MLDYAVIDADGHVKEPPDLWQRRLPKSLRARAPRVIPGAKLRFDVDGVEIPPAQNYSKTTKDTSSRNDDRFEFAASRGYDARSQLMAMDTEGIAASVLFPTTGLVLMGVDGVDPALTTAIAHTYNDFLAEFISEGEGRLFGVACIDPRDVESAAAEARRAVEELGFVGVYMRPNPVNGLPWHHPVYDRLWATLQDLDAPICFHEGSAVLLPQVATDRFEEHVLWHACTHPMEQQMAMASMLIGGVAQRFPRLRMAFLECGAGWLPYWMWRLDEAAEGEQADLTELELTPSEYVERQCFVSIDSDEEPGLHAIDHLSGHRVVWGTDYPHYDGKYPHAVQTVSSLEGMSPENLRSVLHEAPKELFGQDFASRLPVPETSAS